MQGYEEEDILSNRVISGCTPDYVISQLSEAPLITKHWKRNSEENQKALINAFMRLPSRADCPGFIYGFREKQVYNSSDSSYWIKMGRTKRNVPQDRIFEWQKTDNHEYNQIFTVRSEHNIKLELLVHLIFAYARKPIKINNKLRIEWFQFNEKVPTAAITNLANLLMERIHEKYIDKMTVEEERPFPVYDSLINSLSQREKFLKEDFSIVAFGLPKTGKTIFGNIVNGDEVSAEKSEKGLRLKVKPGKGKNIKYFEISDVDTFKTDEEAVANYFSLWHKLCFSQKMLPLLVVKQSDLQSSRLVGLIQGLNLIQKYIKVTNPLLIVVTHARKEFTIKQARQGIEENRQFLNEDQARILINSDFIIIKKPTDSGSMVSSVEQEDINKAISSWTEKVRKQGQGNNSVEFKMDNKYLQICHEIIQKSYRLLQPLFAELFPQQYDLYVDDSLKDDFVHEIGNCISKLKQNNQSQQNIHKIFEKLCNLLELKSSQGIQSYLYAFCELCTNKTLQQSEILSQLDENVNQKIIQIRDKEFMLLQNHLEEFKRAIGLYGKSDKQIVLGLMKVMEEIQLENIISILIKIIEGVKDKTEEGPANFVKATEMIVRVLGEFNEKMKKGFRLDSVFGKIRQTIYYGLKGVVKEREVLKNEVKETEVLKNEVKEREASKNIVKEREVQKKEIDKKEEIKKIEPFTEVKQAEESDNSDMSIYQREEIGDFASLNKKIADYPEGSNVVNIVKEFSIDIPKQYSIKHNIYVLAKKIKVYSDVGMSFKKVLVNSQKKKLNLVIMAQQWVNQNKLNLPGQSPNGKAILLTIIDNKVIPLRPESKNDLLQKTQVIDTIKRLYDNNFK